MDNLTQYEPLVQPLFEEAPIPAPPMDTWFVEAQQPLVIEEVREQPDSFDFTVAPQHFPVDSVTWQGWSPERIDDILREEYLLDWLSWHPDTPVPAIPMDSWFQETQQPTPGLKPVQHPDSFDVTATPQHFPVPEESWKGYAPERVDDLRPVQHPDAFNHTFTPGEFGIPEMSWLGYQPTTIDDIPREEYLFEWHAWHTDTPVVDVSPNMDSWFMEAQLPTIETQPEQPESIFYVINPADFVIPPIVGPCPPGSGAFRTFEGFRAYCGF